MAQIAQRQEEYRREQKRREEEYRREQERRQESIVEKTVVTRLMSYYDQ